MKLTCKQCGKEFELSESEINFYKSRNLHIPKRCEQCRQANKKNKTASAKPYENTHIQGKSYAQNRSYTQNRNRTQNKNYTQNGSYTQNRNYTQNGNYKQNERYTQNRNYTQDVSNTQSSNGGRNNKFLYAILIIAIVLLTSGIILSHADLLDGYRDAAKPLYDENAYTSGDISNQPISEPDAATKLPNDESATANNLPDGESDTASNLPDGESDTASNLPDGESDTANSKSDTDTVNNNSDTEKIKADTSQSTESAANDISATGTEPPAQSSSASEPQYKFRNSELLNEHFEKHGKEMGFATAEDYQAAASAVVTSSDALHKLEAEDGDDVYYIENSNDFVIVSTDGYIRTYFRPNNGIEYYNRQ